MAFIIEKPKKQSLIFEDEKIFLQVEELYVQFSEVVKPLISSVESVLEEFPQELFNEVRSFNDHMMRCFALCDTKEDIEGQIRKSRSHLTRMTLDCYKCLNIGYRDFIVDFQKQTKYVDLTAIDNGQFSGRYNQMYRDAVEKARKAKVAETKSKEIRYDLYGESYIAYLELYNFIIDNTANVNWARAKSYFKKCFAILGWVVATVLSIILANNNQIIIETFKSFLVK